MPFLLPPGGYSGAQYTPLWKYGRVGAISAGDLPADLWLLGASGDVPRPAAPAATNYISDSDEDGAGTATGALTIRAFGRVAGDFEDSEDITLDGTTQVVGAKQFRDVSRMRNRTAGSNERNVGNVDARHGSTVLARMGIVGEGTGGTQQAMFPIPGDFARLWLSEWDVSVGATASSSVTAALDVLEAGATAWYQFDSMEKTSDGGPPRHWPAWPPPIPAGSYVRIRILAVGAPNTVVEGHFSGLLDRAA